MHHRGECQQQNSVIRFAKLYHFCETSKDDKQSVTGFFSNQITLIISSRRAMSTTTTIPPTTPATADLCDKYVTSPSRLVVVQPGLFRDFGGRRCFSGPIETIRCFESNPLVRETLSEPGKARVLVVDGGGSTRCAILGDLLATMALENNWAGLIIYGCIRDSAIIEKIPVGVKALSTHPVKSIKTQMGERGIVVAFAGVQFVPGQWLYADADGILVSETKLTLE